jgi:hypothetical protein
MLFDHTAVAVPDLEAVPRFYDQGLVALKPRKTWEVAIHMRPMSNAELATTPGTSRARL